MISIEAAKQIDVDVALSVLADPTRRRIVEMLGESPRTASELHEAFPIANPAVSRHLRVLRESGVIVEQRVEADGRIRLYALEPRALEAIAAWVGDVGRTWQQQLDSFKHYVSLRSQRVGRR